MGDSTQSVKSRVEGVGVLPPWLTLKPDVSVQALALTAKTYGVPVEVIALMLDEYITQFRKGPAVFGPWLMAQVAAFERGEIAFAPWYPHEVFPGLVGQAPDWLYEEAV